MRKNKQDDDKQKPAPNLIDKSVEQSLEKAIETIKQQAPHYDHVGMTHISSLLS